MTKSITLVEVAAPSSGLTATPAAGGALAASTTYYYRVIAVRRYNSTNILSAPSAEFSASTDTSNKTINLAWDAVANADAYIVQRSTVSGNFGGIGDQKSLRITFVVYTSGYLNATKLTSLTDNGGGNGYYFDNYNADFSRAWPCIECSSDAGETITLNDIYLADVAGSWGVLDKNAPSASWKSSTHAGIIAQIPFNLLGSLYVHDCTFAIRGLLMVWQGGIFCAATTKLNHGDSSFLFCPYVLYAMPYVIAYTTNGTTYGGAYFYQILDSYGTSESTVYGLIRRAIFTHSGSGYAHYPYTYFLYDEGLKSGTFEQCVFGRSSSNAMPIYAGTYERNTFESIRHMAGNLEVVSPVLTKDRYAVNWASNGVVRDATILETCGADIRMSGTGGNIFINPTFESRGQTDNRPYLNLYAPGSSSLGYGILLAFDFDLTVVDAGGDPISGAEVTIIDVDGYSDVWVDSEATLSEDLTADETGVNVSDGSKFAVNDIIRVYGYGERMLVQSIASNTLTVARGQQGTVACPVLYSGNPKIMIQSDDALTTDADGQISAQLNSRLITLAKIEATYDYAGYEDALAASGHVVIDNYSPHTVTISASGYATRVIQYTMDRKREEVEMLREDGTIFYGSTFYGSTLY